MLTIPEYYKKYIDDKVDLNDTKKVCCPFHTEDTPSFSYNHEKGIWHCFGECNTGGDVVALHRKNKGFRTYREALVDLCNLEGLDYDGEYDEIAQQTKISDHQSDISNNILKLDFCLKTNNITEALKVLQELSIYR